MFRFVLIVCGDTLSGFPLWLVCSWDCWQRIGAHLIGSFPIKRCLCAATFVEAEILLDRGRGLGPSQDVLADVVDLYAVPGYECKSRYIRKRGMLDAARGNLPKTGNRQHQKIRLQSPCGPRKRRSRRIDGCVGQPSSSDCSAPFSRYVATPSTCGIHGFRRGDPAINSNGVSIPNLHDGYVIPADAKPQIREMMEKVFSVLGLYSIPRIRIY